MPQQKRTSLLSILIVIGGGLLLIIAAALMAGQIKPAAATPTALVSKQATEAPSSIERVSLEDAKAALDSDAAVFVDVRGAEAYAASHIPGALSIPLAETETRLNELDPDQWIITYCT
jgi:3-mercaptopyruvate sulfurtransferase SseA